MTRLLHRCAPIHSSALAQLVNEAPDAHERRRAVTLYRRTARSMCITVACLVTNALWLASAATRANGRATASPKRCA